MSSDPHGAPVLTQPTPLRIAFAIENHLGHRAVAANLRAALHGKPGIEPIWIPIDATGNGCIDHVPRLRDKHALVLGLSARRGLRRAQRDGTIDVALMHTQRMAHLLVGWMRRTPTFLSIDGTPLLLDRYRAAGSGAANKTGGRYAVIRDAVHRRTYLAARGVICMSELVRRTIVDEYRVPSERTLVLLPGVDVERWRPSERRTADGVVRLLFIGGDFDRKGGPLLVRWARENPHLPCIVDIVTERAVSVPANVRVHLGLKPNDPRLQQLMSNADLFVLPTLADMSPWVVAEAKASGTPVLTTSVGALPEMVRDGHDGWLLEPGDYSALERKLHTLIADPAMLGEFGARARADAVLRLNAAQNAAQLLDFMRKHR
jgi:glycosyltransferase involved in cell wall biosynthesis